MDWFAAQAADSISVPGLPGVEPATRAVVEQGGLLGALLILAIAAIIGLTTVIWRIAHNNQVARDAAQKARDEERDEAAKELHAVNNQRFIEMREMMTALNQNTAAFNLISQSQADRTASSQQLAAGISELILIAKANATTLEDVRRSSYAQGHQAGGAQRAGGGQ